MAWFDFLAGSIKGNVKRKHFSGGAGKQEVHFEGHAPGCDVVNFVLHQVDAIRDSANHQSAQEPRLP